MRALDQSSQDCWPDFSARKEAEAVVEETLVELAKNREDFQAILDQQRVGTVMTNRSGVVVFMSRSAHVLLGKSSEEDHFRRWEDVFPFGNDDLQTLRACVHKQPEQRERHPVDYIRSDGEPLSIDVEIRDDPRNPLQKIFYLYDMSEVRALRNLLGDKARFHDLVGKTESMVGLFALIREVATVNSTALIVGETGTGKELVARAIHASSARSDQAFVTVNCAALTDSLLASQLFGHKKGAFTGATTDHRGFFETADGGTLFLDEIGEIPPMVQTSLLRVLQEREIIPLGSSLPRKVDVRILVATHRDLAVEVEEGRFRADLYYRIRVARVQVPPLRERLEDIPLLVSAFLRELRAVTGKEVTDVSNDTLGAFMVHEWPGNVRELRTSLEYALIRCTGRCIQLMDLPPEILSNGGPPVPAPRGGLVSSHAPAGLQSERESIETALRTVNGNRTRAATLLGFSRATLYRRMNSLGIN